MAEQNSYDFWTRYSNLCLKCKVCPLKSIIKHMRGNTLCCTVERIRSEHWQFLLSAISVDNSLTEVCFKSDLPSLEEQKELWKKRRRKKDESYPCPYGYSSHNISDICKYSARLLTKSQTLQVLIIENLPITKEDALHLAEGLKSTYLKEFALRCYPYSDDAIEIVCLGLWDSNLFLLDFSACNLSLAGLNSIRTVMMKHKERRTVQAFPDTLRYRVPIFEEMMGLTRIILNGNNIGDKGVNMICEIISDDHWIQALDLQCCGITNGGARTLLKQITANNSLQVVDLRLNKIEGPILERISIQLGLNSFGKIINYTHLPLWKPKLFSKALPIPKNKLKPKVTKRYSMTKKVAKKDTKNLHHAVRISCEILDRNGASTKDAMVQTVIADEIKFLKERNRNLEFAILKEASAKDSMAETSEKYKSENYKLCHINDNLRQENFNLRQEVLRCQAVESAIVIDQETYAEIKHVFEKFQRFLKLMKDNGLWGLVSTIGVAEYENTRLKAVASDSKVRLVEKDHSPPDGCPSNGPVKVPSVPKPQRCCSCRKPDCISNQKAEKGNHASNLNQAQKVNEAQLKNIVDKAKVTKVFKELRETYTNCDFGKQVPPRSNRKHSLEDLPSGLKSGPTTKPLSLKCVLNRDIPNKFKQIKTHQDLYEAVRSEMEKKECVCQIHKTLKSPDKSGQSVENHTNVNNRSYFRNVSSQTAAVESLSNYKCQKMSPVVLSGSASSGITQKSGNQSNSSTIKTSPQDVYSLHALSLVAREWDEHVKKNFPDCNIEPRGTAAGAEGTSNSILVDPEYFKTWATSKAQEYLPPDLVPDFSKVSGKEPVPLQGTPKSTSSKNASLFSGNSAGNYASEQKIKTKSNQTSSNIDNSKRSYLESVSDKEPASLQGTPKSTSSENANLFSANSVGSHTGEQKIKTKSNQTSSNRDNSNKSYLESVSDASTDKDVKSLSGSEVYESVKSDSVNSKNSNKSNKSQKAVTESGVNPGVTNSVLSNNSSKSSKRSQKQKKNSNQNASGGGKVPKENVSSSSVPSLSDITTVSSHSLNTDSVMGQLSESEKGYS